MKYRSKAVHFFSESEKKRIEEATAEAESRTVGEIAVMVVDESSHYHEAEVIGGFVVSSFVAFVLTVFLFHESIWWYIPWSCIFFFPGWFLFKKAPVLKVHCVGDARKEKAVKERALKAFYEKGLYRTKKNTGVLFFLSLLEHKVWVIADKGIHERIKQPALDDLARHVALGIHEGRSADALIAAIGDTGRLLAQHYPHEASDVDELSNDILYEGKTE